MHTQRLCALSGALLGMLMTGVALVAMGEHIHADLWITLALFTLAWLVVLSSEATRPLSAVHCWGVGVPAAAAVLVAGLNLPRLWTVWQHATSTARTAGVPVWVGCYLGVLLAGTVLLLGVLAPWRGQVRTAAARRWLRRAAAVVGLVMAAWVTQRVLRYVPANQATYAQIQLGMTAREVDALFGRPPFLDSDTAPTGADLRAALQRDTRERGWDGPEGQIIVTFNREGRVDRALFTPASHPPTPLDWLRARLGLWP